MSKTLFPNILVTGTPGTGKTALCEAFLKSTQDFDYHNVATLIRDNNLYDEWDSTMQATVYNERAVRKFLTQMLKLNSHRGKLIDFHDCSVLKRSELHLIIVLRSSTEHLFDRLTARGYPEHKVQENVQCEIFGISAEEVHDTFNQIQVWEVDNNIFEDQKIILDRLRSFVDSFKSDAETSRRQRAKKRARDA